MRCFAASATSVILRHWAPRLRWPLIRCRARCASCPQQILADPRPLLSRCFPSRAYFHVVLQLASPGQVETGVALDLQACGAVFSFPFQKLLSIPSPFSHHPAGGEKRKGGPADDPPAASCRRLVLLWLPSVFLRVSCSRRAYTLLTTCLDLFNMPTFSFRVHMNLFCMLACAA